MVPSLNAWRSCAFLIWGSSLSTGLEVRSPLVRSLTSRMPYFDERRFVVDVNDATADDNSTRSVSICLNDRVARSASFFRSALKYDLAIVAAHQAQLTSTKFNSIDAHISVLM